jgi:1-acyl-sn-glycerol-3-phosphate acyltransferase
MNNQPYGVPTQHWPPKLTYWWYYAARPWRRNAIRKQKFVKIDVDGLEHLRTVLDQGYGVMLTPNHSFHWDSYCLLEASDRLATPFYIMTAWQVFALSGWFERESMQRCGCFSVDREGTDMQSMKTAVDILQKRREPLVIFPEGDVYHTNDRLTPLRDGAAAMALMAARKSERPVCIVPTAIKRWYLDDPSPSMLATAEQLERRLFWRPNEDVPLVERILKIADGVLALKELERFGATHQGELPKRITRLADAILDQAEERYGLAPAKGMLPERVKEVRKRIIQLRSESEGNANESQKKQWHVDMEDMFLVTQLYSYPGDYLIEKPTWERQAETLDKLEEDVLGATYPSPRGRLAVQVRLGEPIELPQGKDKKLTPSDLTRTIQQSIQSMLDSLNLEHEQQTGDLHRNP